MSNRFSNTRARLIGSAAILALSAGAAMAQEGVEQVVVSSTRLQAAGFDAPTPTTVISAADLEAQAKPNMFDALTHLPALQGSTGAALQAGSTTTGLIGLSSLGLRGLSPAAHPGADRQPARRRPATSTARSTSARCRRC